VHRTPNPIVTRSSRDGGAYIWGLIDLGYIYGVYQFQHPGDLYYPNLSLTAHILENALKTICLAAVVVP
jgi:hypothetical protein